MALQCRITLAQILGADTGRTWHGVVVSIEDACERKPAPHTKQRTCPCSRLKFPLHCVDVLFQACSSGGGNRVSSARVVDDVPSQADVCVDHIEGRHTSSEKLSAALHKVLIFRTNSGS